MRLKNLPKKQKRKLSQTAKVAYRVEPSKACTV